jgi:hypothetical protein
LSIRKQSYKDIYALRRQRDGVAEVGKKLHRESAKNW